MSVVAGCSLFGGVLLLADCRATIIRPRQSPIYVDAVQKLIPLTRTTVLAFVGDIRTAIEMLRLLPECLSGRTASGKLTAVGIRNWLPRYLRYRFAALQPSCRAEVTFVAAGVVPGRPNVIERAKVADLMSRLMKDETAFKRNWLPGIVVRVLSVSTQWVRLVDQPLGLLYVMRSPHFLPEDHWPLEFCAIGSGGGVLKQIDREADWIFMGEVGNPFMESMALRECVRHFIQENAIDSVGGLFPCVKLDASGLHFLGYSSTFGDDRIELTTDEHGRWIQKDVKSGTAIPLVYPWEIHVDDYRKSRRFDYLNQAEERFLKRDSD